MNLSLAKGLHDVPLKALESGKQSPAADIFGTIPFYTLLVTIALFSLPSGAVYTSHRSLLIFLVAVIATFRIIESLGRRSLRVAEPGFLLPLVGVLGLAFIQTVQWPGAASAISVDPYETRSFILTFGSLIIAAEVLFLYTTTTHRLKCVVGLVIAVGSFSAVFGLVQAFYFDSRSAWLPGQFFPEQGFAQFINRNHFALLIEMALGLLLGVLIKGGIPARFKLVGWILAAIMAYSAIAANSRGGLVSLAALILFAVAAYLMTRQVTGNGFRKDLRRNSFSWMTQFRRISAAAGILLLVTGLIVVIIAFVGGETTVTRFEKLRDELETVNSAGVNRNLIWKATLDLFESEPLFGVGFGGYGAAITNFDTSGGKYRLQQAHNEYLEILSNGGIVGFALFALFAVMVGRRTWKNVKSADSFREASSFGAAMGIFGVLIHSFVDFGLHIPINAFIFAVLIVIATVDIKGIAPQDGEKVKIALN